MSTESLPPLDDPSQADTVQQYVMHGLLTALYGASPKEYDRRIREIFGYLDQRCGTNFSERESSPSQSASPLHQTEVARPVATSVLPRGAESPPLPKLFSTTHRVIPFRNRLGLVTTKLARHWRAGVGGLAAAAVLVFSFVAYLQNPQSARADDALFRRIALQFVYLPSADPFLSDDPAALANRLAEIDSLKSDRDKFVQLAAQATDDKSRDQANGAAMQPWQAVYRRLRDIGRLQEAMTESQALIEYIQSDPNLRNPQGSLKSTLADVGNIYMAAAEYPNARKAYMASIDVRVLDSQQIASRDGWTPDRPERFTSPVHSLTPLYGSMILLCIAERKLEEAHDWCQRAEDSFRAYFVAICRANGIVIPDGPDALSAFRAMPPLFQNPPQRLTQEETDRYEAQYKGFVPTIQHVTKFREYLLVRTRLALTEERISVAEETLQIARGVAYSPCHDESRLDFNEPLLAARIAIAEKRYQDALGFIADAEQHTGMPSCSDQANNRPIASSRIAELTLLKGVALLGVDEKCTEGTQLVEQGLRVPTKLADGLPPGQREAFMKQFEPWQKLADEVRRIKP